MEDIDNGGYTSRGYGKSVPSPQFCCEPKTAQTNLILKKYFQEEYRLSRLPKRSTAQERLKISNIKYANIIKR